jgi:hypothetical protein
MGFSFGGEHLVYYVSPAAEGPRPTSWSVRHRRACPWLFPATYCGGGRLGASHDELGWSEAATELRIGIVGLGAASGLVHGARVEDVRLAAGADIRPGARAGFTHEHGMAAFYR